MQKNVALISGARNINLILLIISMCFTSERNAASILAFFFLIFQNILTYSNLFFIVVFRCRECFNCQKTQLLACLWGRSREIMGPQNWLAENASQVKLHKNKKKTSANTGSPIWSSFNSDVIVWEEKKGITIKVGGAVTRKKNVVRNSSV